MYIPSDVSEMDRTSHSNQNQDNSRSLFQELFANHYTKSVLVDGDDESEGDGDNGGDVESVGADEGEIHVDLQDLFNGDIFPGVFRYIDS